MIAQRSAAAASTSCSTFSDRNTTSRSNRGARSRISPIEVETQAQSARPSARRQVGQHSSTRSPSRAATARREARRDAARRPRPPGSAPPVARSGRAPATRPRSARAAASRTARAATGRRPRRSDRRARPSPARGPRPPLARGPCRRTAAASRTVVSAARAALLAGKTVAQGNSRARQRAHLAGDFLRGQSALRTDGGDPSPWLRRALENNWRRPAARHRPPGERDQAARARHTDKRVEPIAHVVRGSCACESMLASKALRWRHSTSPRRASSAAMRRRAQPSPSGSASAARLHDSTAWSLSRPMASSELPSSNQLRASEKDRRRRAAKPAGRDRRIVLVAQPGHALPIEVTLGRNGPAASESED